MEASSDLFVPRGEVAKRQSLGARQGEGEARRGLDSLGMRGSFWEKR